MIGYCLYTESRGVDIPASIVNSVRQFLHGGIEPGNFIIYRKSKVSRRPGPRARNVQASEKGDDYYYEVDKYWAVEDVLDDGRVVAVTRTGKHVELTPEDENLRKAGLLERLLLRSRFPSV